MKILHIIAAVAPRYGGPSKACLEMATASARRGHEVWVYTTDKDGPDRLDVPTDRPVPRNGVRLRYFPVQAPRFWATSWPLARALSRDIRNFDVVHLHSLYLFHDWIAGHYCHRHGVPYIVRPHGTLDPYIHRRHRLRKRVMELLFQERVLRRAAAIHYTSEDERRLAEPHACGAPGAVVPIGLDLDAYATLPPAGTFRTKHPEIGDRRLVLFLGRLNFKKGLDILAKAFGELARGRTDLHLVVAGPDDGMRGKTERWLRDEGVLERTTFTGMLAGEDKLAALRDGDVFVLPSYSENFGIAAAEAMACGLPVVISDRVNIWREVESAGAGAVVGCDADEVAGAVQRILDDPDAAQRMGENGRGLVRTRFSWPRIAHDLENLYREAAARRGRPYAADPIPAHPAGPSRAGR